MSSFNLDNLITFSLEQAFIYMKIWVKLSYECNLGSLQRELKEGSSVLSSIFTNIFVQHKKIKYF